MRQPSRSPSASALVRASLSGACLLLLVVAVPAVLLAVGGSPIPRGGVHRLVAMIEARRGFDSHIALSWLVHGSLLLAWVTWAWLVVCVVIELRAWITGRSAPHLPGSRTLQAVAACLVGTSLALVSMGRVLPAPSTSVMDHLPPIEHALVGSEVAGNRAPDPMPVASDPVGGTFARPSAGGPNRKVATLRVVADLDGDPDVAHPDGHLGHSHPLPMDGGRPPDGGRAVAFRTGEVAEPTSPWGDPVRKDVAGTPARSSASVEATTPTTVPEDRLHRVTGRETLWSIADTRLGAARRWREIADLNYSVRQSDGRSLTETHWVEPGWVLILPDPDVSDAPLPASGPTGPRHRGRTEAGSRSRTADSVGYGPTTGSSHRARSVDGSTPPADRLAGMTVLPPDLLTAGPGAAPPVDDRVATEVSEALLAAASSGRTGRGPVDLVGAGLLGAGLVALLDRMRRAQHRHRRDGALIPLPHGSGAAMEGRLRSGDGRRVLSVVDGGLRAFLEPATRDGQAPPWIQGVLVHAASIEIVVSEPPSGAPAVAAGRPEVPVGPGTGRRSVSLPLDAVAWVDRPAGEDDPPSLRTGDGAETRIEAGPHGGPAVGMAAAPSWTSILTPASIPAPTLTPTLVTVGRGADGPLLVNLENLGSMGLVGTRDACEGIVRALALELATSRWAGGFDLVLVGFGAEMSRFERVEVVTDGVELLHRLDRRRIAGDELLRARGLDSFAHGRARGYPDCDPLVVVAGPDADPEMLPELVAAGSDPRTAAAIVACGAGLGAWHSLTIPDHGGSGALEPIGAAVFPQCLSDADYGSVHQLLETATQRRSVDTTAPPYASLSIPLPGAAGRSDVTGASAPPAAGGAADPDDDRVTLQASAGGSEIEIEVQVLGPIEVLGAARPFTRAWAKELVVYLAMHPQGVSNDAWAAALWPDRLMASSSLHSTASVARRSLGHGADGRDHLPRSHGRLGLARTVGTDWERFVRLAEPGGVDDLRQALELVRGRPFDGLRAADWPILEGIAPAIEAAVVDVAGRLAGLYLGRGDASGAEWAARRGLVVSPYDERLYRMLLRAADVAGNPAGVESVMSELLRLVADEVEPFDSVHPSTMELYRSLTRRSRLVGVPR